MSITSLLPHECRGAAHLWKGGGRPDKRQFTQLREIKYEFPVAMDRGHVVVRLGETQVSARVFCDLVEPYENAPKHGFLDFCVQNITPSAMDAAFGGSTGRQDPRAHEVLRLLNMVIKGSRVLDTESLCVLTARRVWSIRVDLVLLNDDGNLCDCAVLAAMASLMHFRRPDISIVNNEVTVYTAAERDPVPLALHHIPLPVTFAIVETSPSTTSIPAAPSMGSVGGGSSATLDFVLDPTIAETLAAACLITVAVNLEGQVCSISKVGGPDLPYELVKRCIGAAKQLVPLVATQLAEELKQDEQARKTASLAKFQWAKSRIGVGKGQAESVTPSTGDATKRSRE